MNHRFVERRVSPPEHGGQQHQQIAEERATKRGISPSRDDEPGAYK